MDRAVAILDFVSERGVEGRHTCRGRAHHPMSGRRCAANSTTRGTAARRYDLVDPTKRHVARELDPRWNAVLERIAQLEDRIARLDRDAAFAPKSDRVALMQLAYDLPAA